MVTTGAIRRAKLQSNRHHQQTNIQFFLQAGCMVGSGRSRHSNFLSLCEHSTPSEGDVENLAADQMMKGR